MCILLGKEGGGQEYARGMGDAATEAVSASASGWLQTVGLVRCTLPVCTHSAQPATFNLHAMHQNNLLASDGDVQRNTCATLQTQATVACTSNFQMKRPQRHAPKRSNQLDTTEKTHRQSKNKGRPTERETHVHTERQRERERETLGESSGSCYTSCMACQGAAPRVLEWHSNRVGCNPQGLHSVRTTWQSHQITHVQMPITLEHSKSSADMPHW